MGLQTSYCKVRKGGNLLAECVSCFTLKASGQNLTPCTVGAVNCTSFIVLRVCKGSKVE